MSEIKLPERLAIDIDGVLANFTEPFSALVSEMFSLEVPHAPVHWNWYRDYGVTDEQDRELWTWITNNPEWWGQLSALPSARMAIAYLRESGCEVYFMTARPGFGVKMITENWLRHHGYPDPTVLIASDKAPIVKALKIDAFIDDKPETCQDVDVWLNIDPHTGQRFDTPRARVFMPDRPWNQTAFDAAVQVTRVPELVDALSILWGAEKSDADAAA